ncbi:MAG: ribosomal protein S18-alanine N-acetyltransferase [Firmicutes bacterium]|nr:ribosomal protein S18-alanine N-acetyltransferase [Bacillota bacterium]
MDEQNLVVEFRPMRLTDLDQVQEVERNSFPHPWSYSAFVSELVNNDNARYIVATVEGRVVGYIGVWIILDEGHITNVAVHPLYRKRGIAQQLFKEITDVVKGCGVTKLTLEVRISNFQAQQLYYKLGFSRAGIRPGYYQDNEDAVIMWKDLREEKEENDRSCLGY